MKTYVLKLGGAVCLEKETLDLLAKGLKQVMADGHRAVVVHGGGPQIDKALSALGEPIVKHKGLRRTSPGMMDVVKREMDKIGARLAAELWDRGVDTVHVGSTARVLAARPKTLADGFDLGRVGTFAGIHVDDILKGKNDALAASDPQRSPGAVGVPIVTPVGHDEDGPLNINADEAAAAVAAAVGSHRLLLATDVDAVLDSDGEPLRSIDEAMAAALIFEGVAEGGMVPKLMAAVAALEAGVSSVIVGRLAGDCRDLLLEDVPDHGTRITVRGTTTKVFHAPDAVVAGATE